LGIAAIKQKEKTRHMILMTSAFIASTLFLITYVIYHSLHGDTHYLGQGVMKFIYFFTLISHIVLTIGALPLILTTFFLSLTERFTLHKKIGRITYPLWLYVSVTGVLIYVLQKL
jgi:putative membrane protein